MKSCKKCGVSKNIEEFYLVHGKPKANCKICTREEMKKWYEENKESQLATRKQFRIQNHHWCLIRDRKWYEENIDWRRSKNRELYQKNREAILQSQKSRDQLKVAARKAIYGAVKYGKIKRPDNCERCDNPKVEAHHHMGYDKENWFNVRWLCRKHHMEEHRIEISMDDQIALLQ